MSSKAWKAHVGDVAWPTILLFVAVMSGEVAVWTLALTGAIPLWAGGIVAVVLAYLAFTVGHEAAHGNIHGPHRRLKWLGDVMGWLSAAILVAPFSAFRVLHLQHHSHVNDGDADPDHWVASDHMAGVIARCATIMPYYYFTILVGPSSRTNAGRKVRRGSLATVALFVAGAALITYFGYGLELLTLWFLPAVVASGILAFVFDWWPHQPHDTVERYHDTRVVLGPGLEVLTLGQSYHLIHHLYPRIPFYRYGRCFHDMREDLESRGVRIDTF